MTTRTADPVEVETRGGRVTVRPSLPARSAIGLVRGYQRAAAGRPSPCRYVPSCSTYAVEALQVHGLSRGAWFALRRVARCHPWGGHGHDPVPDPAVMTRSH